MADETKGKVLELVERELSRLLNYAYAGFLALLIFHVVEPDNAKTLISDLGWELVVLACIVIGAGIYRVHRSVVIPIHHLFGCFLFWVWDRLNRTKEAESVSPTRWFRSLSVPPRRLILAYNVLRHDPEFLTRKEQQRLDLMHAEFGLVIMAAEACIFVAAYAAYKLFRFHGSAWWVPWAWLGVGFLLLAASYPAPIQEHAIECLCWRTRENEEIDEENKNKLARPVSTTLRKYGLPKLRATDQPANPAS